MDYYLFISSLYINSIDILLLIVFLISSEQVNPPYHMPLVELVPAPWTDPEVVTRSRALLKEVGQSPVTLKKEIPGFVQPRIQYALLQECLKLAIVSNDI